MIQYEGVTSYLLEYIKEHEFLLLEKDEVEAEDGIALEFHGMIDSGLFLSRLIYEIEDEYRNSYIDFAYDDYLYISRVALNISISMEWVSWVWSWNVKLMKRLKRA